MGGTFSFCFPPWLRTSLSAGSFYPNSKHKRSVTSICFNKPHSRVNLEDLIKSYEVTAIWQSDLWQTRRCSRWGRKRDQAWSQLPGTWPFGPWEEWTRPFWRQTRRFLWITNNKSDERGRLWIAQWRKWVPGRSKKGRSAEIWHPNHVSYSVAKRKEGEVQDDFVIHRSNRLWVIWWIVFSTFVPRLHAFKTTVSRFSSLSRHLRTMNTDIFWVK